MYRCTSLAPTLFFFFTACNNQPQTETHLDPPHGQLGLAIHDAPADVTSLTVTLSRLDFKRCQGEGFESISFEPTNVDLLQFQNGALADIFHGIDVPAGEYCELRLVLDSATLVTETGEQSIITPSCGSSGCKIKGDFSIYPYVVTNLSVDFNVDESLYTTGSGTYVLHPIMGVDSVTYTTDGGGKLPDATYAGYVEFTIEPDIAKTIDLGGGSFLHIPAGAVSSTENFAATRWSPNSPSIHSDIFVFSPHYQFNYPLRLELAYIDDSPQGEVLLDYTTLRTTESVTHASANIGHFCTTACEANPCEEDPSRVGFWCNSSRTQLYQCDGSGSSKYSWECDCKAEGDQTNDGCYWYEAPWNECLRLSTTRIPAYHDGPSAEYKIGLDFPRLDASITNPTPEQTPDLICGFDECEVEYGCRSSGAEFYGPHSICVYETENNARTGRWMFVAHMASVEPSIDQVFGDDGDVITPLSRGAKIGEMGREGNATGYHFHIEFGIDGSASSWSDSGDFPPPFDRNVQPGMKFCQTDVRRELDVIEDPGLPEIVDADPTQTCETSRTPPEDCLNTQKYTDMPADESACFWCDAARHLACSNVMTGYDGNRFLPGQNITRAEFLKIVLDTAYPCLDFPSMADLDPSQLPFPDMKANDWFLGYAQFAKAEGIISGKPDGATFIFAGNDAIHREEAVKILIAAAVGSNVQGYMDLHAMFDPSVNIDDADEFLDVKNPNEWYYAYIYAGRAAGVLNGYGNGWFGVGDNLLRSQAATLVYRIID